MSMIHDKCEFDSDVDFELDSNFDITSEDLEKFYADIYKEPQKKKSYLYCREPDCTRLGYYNYKQSKNKFYLKDKKDAQIRYCKKHKKEGMINITYKICLEQGCEKRASCGEFFRFPTHCGEHKKEGMVNALKKCEIADCFLTPSFDYPESKTVERRCSIHKLSGMINKKYEKRKEKYSKKS
jgi:hypothetical protein